jgi:hypothetical protein
MSQWVVCINNVLYHIVREDTLFKWQPFWGDVMGPVGNAPGTIVAGACVVDTAGNLQLVIQTSSSSGSVDKLWHTFRDPGGVWQSFWGDVYGQTGTPSLNVKLLACSAGTDGTFQIMILLADEKTALHTVRYTTGAWQQWLQVGVTGLPPPGNPPLFLVGG